ncbi:MAG TPA: hypothetical protein VN812_22750 [Candidatus Acidoferrales bacterium]|nr:hypothetical protein [Candidatus Acidoferrales bacterium]
MSAFLGITRERVFSPGRVADDRAILEAVAACLRRRGHLVTVFGGDDERWPEPTGGTVVFTMSQGEEALAQLQRWAARGVRIVNPPAGILNCQRHRTIVALAQAQIPFPESVVVDTREPPVLPAWVGNGGAWIKRGDVHATEADDVVRIDGGAAARQALEKLRARGIRRALVQRHVPGTVLKFYAVRERFFHCVPPGHGQEIAAPVLRNIDTLGAQAARALNLEVYGGDCVVAMNGRLQLIDLNDWPSYAPCRAGAAEAIAANLLAHDVTIGT